METQITSDLLAWVAGILLSLLASYVPGFNTWYANLEPVRKRLLMLAALFLAAAGVVALSCANVLALVTCTQGGIVFAVRVFILALIANQAAFMVSPPTGAVRETRALGQASGENVRPEGQ